MDPDAVAPMVLGMTFFIVGGAVVLLRPITKRLGSYLEVLAEERRRRAVAPPTAQSEERLASALESLDRRLGRLEERQAFTDALLAERQPAALPTRVE